MKYLFIFILILSLSCSKGDKSYQYSIVKDWVHVKTDVVLENNSNIMIGGIHLLRFSNDGTYSYGGTISGFSLPTGTYKRISETKIEVKRNNYPEVFHWEIVNLNDSLLTFKNNEDIRDTLCLSSPTPCYAITTATVHYKKY